MQGDCSGPVAELDSDDRLILDLLALMPAQCLVYTDNSLLNFYGSTSSPFEARSRVTQRLLTVNLLCSVPVSFAATAQLVSPVSL